MDASFSGYELSSTRRMPRTQSETSHEQEPQMTKQSTGPFSIAPGWAARHAQGASTDSSTLPPAAFPSLPMNGPPQAAPIPRPREDSAANLTDSDKEEATPTPPASDDSDALNAASSPPATQSNSDSYASSKDLNPNERTTAQQDPRSLPLPPSHQPKSSRTKRPRSLNYETLQATHTSLSNKRRMLEHKLRTLNYDVPRPGSSAHIDAPPGTALLPHWAQQPSSIDALWRAVQELRAVNSVLEVRECHARQVAQARRGQFTRLPRYGEGRSERTVKVFRAGGGDAALPSRGWDGDGDARAMRSAARRCPVGAHASLGSMATAATAATPTEGQQGDAYDTAHWPRAPYMPRQRPLPTTERRKASNAKSRVPKGGAVKQENGSGQSLLNSVSDGCEDEDEAEDEDDGLGADSAAAWNQDRALRGL